MRSSIYYFDYLIELYAACECKQFIFTYRLQFAFTVCTQQIVTHRHTLKVRMQEIQHTCEAQSQSLKTFFFHAIDFTLHICRAKLSPHVGLWPAMVSSSQAADYFGSLKFSQGKFSTDYFRVFNIPTLPQTMAANVLMSYIMFYQRINHMCC